MTHLKQAQENRAFMNMMQAAKEWLTDREPLNIAEKTGLNYDEKNSRFHFTSFGTEICIHYPNYTIDPRINEWQQLLILHYMNLADGTPLTGKWISMGELRDGLIRGGDFDRRCEQVIRHRLSQIEINDFSEKCLRIGGRILDSNADFTVQFDFLPYYPLLLKLWFADEEFPASGKLLLDASSDHYLTIEDAVTAGQILMETLVGVF